jgi:hypothetical protein
MFMSVCMRVSVYMHVYVCMHERARTCVRTYRSGDDLSGWLVVRFPHTERVYSLTYSAREGRGRVIHNIITLHDVKQNIV